MDLDYLTQYKSASFVQQKHGLEEHDDYGQHMGSQSTFTGSKLIAHKALQA